MEASQSTDGVFIEITASAEKATEALSSVAEQLGKIKNNGTLKAANGMKSQAEALSDIVESLSKIDSGSADAVNSVFESVKKLSEAKISKALANNISEIFGSVKGIDATGAGAVNSMFASISAINGVKLSSTIAKNIERISESIKMFDNGSIDMLERFCNEVKKIDGVDLGNVASAVRAFSSKDEDSIRRTAEAAIARAESSDFRSQRSIMSSDLAADDTVDELMRASEAMVDYKEDLVAALGSGHASSASIAEMTKELKQQTSTVNACNSKLNEEHRLQQKIADSAEDAADSEDELSEKFNRLATSAASSIYTIRSVVDAIRSLVSGFKELTTKSMEYIENMNLAQTAMGTSFFESEYNFAMKVQDALGIDSAEWIRYEGVFSTLTKGMGATSEQADEMSRNLTQLGYDLSSFYNMDVEDAMLKIQSGIAGELEPLRRIGYDLSVSRMNLDAVNLGLEENVNTMSQADKVLLRYYEIMTQVTWAQGDMARTINQPANQLRVMNSQITILARNLGNLLIPAFNAVAPYLIGFIQLLNEAMQSIANLFGVDLTFDVDWSSVDTSGISSVVDDTTDSLDDATASAKELKRQLLGFDEINNLTTSNSSTSGSSGTSGVSYGTANALDFGNLSYDFLGGLVETNVESAKEKIKDTLFLAKTAAEGAAVLSKSSKVMSVISQVSNAFKGTAIASKLSPIAEFVGAMITKVPILGTLIGKLGTKTIPVIGWALLAVDVVKGLIESISWLSSESYEDIDVLSGVSDDVKNAYGDSIDTVRDAFSELDNLEVADKVITENDVTSISGKAESVANTLIGTLDSDKNSKLASIDSLEAAGEITSDRAAEMREDVNNSYNSQLSDVKTLSGSITSTVKSAWESNRKLTKSESSEIKSTFKSMTDSIGKNAGASDTELRKISTGLSKATKEDAKQTASTIIKNAKDAKDKTIAEAALLRADGVLTEEEFEAIKTSAEEDFAGVVAAVQKDMPEASQYVNLETGEMKSNFETLGLKIAGIPEYIKEMFENIVYEIDNAFPGFREKIDEIKEVAEDFSKPFQAAAHIVEVMFSDIKTVIDNKKKSLKEAIDGLKEIFTNSIFGGLPSGLKDDIESLLTKVKTIFAILKVIYTGAFDAGYEYIMNWDGFTSSGVEFASGGFPSTGQMFIARESGPELVGSIGSRTAVVNNSQIVESVALGVESAVARAMSSYGGGGTSNVGLSVNLDGRQLVKSINRVNRVSGRMIVGVR